MEAAKPEVHLSRSTNKIETKFQGYAHVFGVPELTVLCNTVGSCFSGANPRWRPEKQKLVPFFVVVVSLLFLMVLSTSCNLPVIALFRGTADYWC